MAESTSQLSILVKVRDEASSTLNRLSSDVSDLGGNLGFAGDKAGILASALAAVGATAILKTAIQDFADAEAKMASFDAIVKTLPPGLQKFRDEMIRVGNEALLKFGFDNEDATLALGRLFQATGNAPEAFAAFQTAMDLARAKGIDLATATQLLIVAFEGGGRILKQYGIEVDDHASHATILAAITQRLAGQTEAYSHTLAGQLAIGQQIMKEFSESLGSVFAPAIEYVISHITKWIEANGGMQATVEKLKPLLIWLAAFLTLTLVAGIVASTVAFFGFIGVSAGVIAAIVAVASVFTLFVVLWKNGWEQARAIFELAKIGISGAWNALVSFIRDTFGGAIDWIRSQLQGIVDFFNYVVGLVTRPISNAVKGASDTLSSVISSLRGILHLAGGGIVTSPSFATIAETEPEAVIPLSRLGAAGIGGGMVINMSGTFMTSTEAAEAMGNEIARIIKYQLKL